MNPPTLPAEEVIPLILRLVGSNNVLCEVEDQLCEYGYTQLAQVVAEQTDTPVDLTPSSKLAELLYIAKEQGRNT
ncbi:10696_t:CDS:2, partial [Acaulospora morrowiae]